MYMPELEAYNSSESDGLLRGYFGDSGNESSSDGSQQSWSGDEGDDTSAGRIVGAAPNGAPKEEVPRAIDKRSEQVPNVDNASTSRAPSQLPCCSVESSIPPARGGRKAGPGSGHKLRTGRKPTNKAGRKRAAKERTVHKEMEKAVERRAKRDAMRASAIAGRDKLFREAKNLLESVSQQTCRPLLMVVKQLGREVAPNDVSASISF